MHNLAFFQKNIITDGVFPVLKTDLCLRSPEVQVKYEERLEEIKPLTPAEYITKKYNFKGNEWAFVLNEFPYDLDNDIKHFVLWINNKDQKEVFVRRAIDFIISRLTEFVWFENDKKGQSVELTHFHFITKNHP